MKNEYTSLVLKIYIALLFVIVVKSTGQKIFARASEAGLL